MKRFHHEEKNISGQTGGKLALKQSMKGGEKKRKERKGKRKKGGNGKKDSYALLSDSFSWSPEHTFRNQAGDQRLIK